MRVLAYCSIYGADFSNGSEVINVGQFYFCGI
jgi:hypothetical protein